ncbi:methyltransferase domain-containing protein [Ruegeria sp. R13_0]|uniref:class I SAM-dependent methyltransferase n=1 Tax=Ruegeria sp. R13_0 TaxID=2821099 RepID=UPI001ADD1267|nr:methyltransferase domain-containing protein [Ruegeria sp. R13_0]MBO9436672.1 methyltransferase domain-containing protein [Ruegeria sp. R13_0]
MTKPEFIARQGRRPTGLLGAIVARVMARETRPENDRALELLDLEYGDRLIDIGCGHGETLFKADRKVRLRESAGVDFSEVMLRRAGARNREAVWDMRLTLHHADTASLPFDTNRFDKALSVHTIYFWPDPVAQLTEAFRVLCTGGRFVLCYRSTADQRAVDRFPDTIYRFPSVPEVEDTLRLVGFDPPETLTANLAGRLTHWTIALKPVDGVRQPTGDDSAPCRDLEITKEP